MYGHLFAVKEINCVSKVLKLCNMYKIVIKMDISYKRIEKFLDNSEGLALRSEIFTPFFSY